MKKIKINDEVYNVEQIENNAFEVTSEEGWGVAFHAYDFQFAVDAIGQTFGVDGEITVNNGKGIVGAPTVITDQYLVHPNDRQAPVMTEASAFSMSGSSEKDDLIIEALNHIVSELKELKGVNK